MTHRVWAFGVLAYRTTVYQGSRKTVRGPPYLAGWAGGVRHRHHAFPRPSLHSSPTPDPPSTHPPEPLTCSGGLTEHCPPHTHTPPPPPHPPTYAPPTHLVHVVIPADPLVWCAHVAKRFVQVNHGAVVAAGRSGGRGAGQVRSGGASGTNLAYHPSGVLPTHLPYPAAPPPPPPFPDSRVHELVLEFFRVADVPPPPALLQGAAVAWGWGRR